MDFDGLNVGSGGFPLDLFWPACHPEARRNLGWLKFMWLIYGYLEGVEIKQISQQTFGIVKL